MPEEPQKPPHIQIVKGDASGGSVPQSMVQPSAPSDAGFYAPCFERECGNVLEAMLVSHEEVALSVENLTCDIHGPDDEEPTDWYHVRKWGFSFADKSVCVPTDLLRRIVIPPESLVTPKEFARCCGLDGPYIGVLEPSDEDWVLSVFAEVDDDSHGEDESTVLAEWDEDDLTDEDRWEGAYDEWRQDSQSNLRQFFRETHAEMQRFASLISGPVQSQIALRLPPGLARLLLGGPGAVCPDCLQSESSGFTFGRNADGSFTVRLYCSSCSNDRPDSDDDGHVVSSWGSGAEFADQKRLDQVWHRWLSGEEIC